MYHAVGVVAPESDFTPDELLARLTAQFPGFAVARTESGVSVSKGEWWIAVAIRTDGVAGEIEGLLGHVSGVEPAEAEAFVAGGTMIDAQTDVPDPFMEHFNDYLTLVGALKSFQSVLVIDPKSHDLL
jgi:hypothetical protein